MSTPESKPTPAPPFSAPAETCDTPSCARDRIFQTARNLFYRHGIRGVSVDTIAAEAHTTKVTLYRVFDSKDDLIVQCLEDHTRRFWQAWDEAMAPFAGEPRKQIEALFDLLKARVCTEETDRGCPIANAGVEIVDDDHPAKRVVIEHKTEMARRLRVLCADMGAARPDDLAGALTLLIEGVFAVRAVCHEADQVEMVAAAARALLDSSDLGAPQEVDRAP